MFDASYFKNGLSADISAAGGKSTVEVHLMNAHTHRVRSVLDANAAYVTLEAYRQRVDGGRSEQYWEAAPDTPDVASGTGTAEVVRVLVSYESIVEIVITPAEDAAAPRIGFVRA